MLSCKEIVKLINTEEKLSFVQRAELKMHLMMCKHCSAYFKHLGFMKNAFKKLFGSLTSTDASHIEKLENKIIDKVKKSPLG